MLKVNLDALVPREDFEVEESNKRGQKKSTLSIEDIKPDSFFYSQVRKPDFQRETNEWDPNKICDFVSSFISGDLIPAIILWQNKSGFLFVIDGSHRLSCLASWINDDYGDGVISKSFYESVIPDEQMAIAERTRKLINKNIGSYSDYKLALTHPQKVKVEIIEKAKNLGAQAIQLQWVEGDASTAENSFFKINQQAAPINKTEIKLLQSRKKPNSIAARAIIRSGKGHKYWSLFPADKQITIQELAGEINDILFEPKLETPIKTLDIPIGGKLYSAQTLPLVLDFVNASNEMTQQKLKDLENDKDGDKTIHFLKKARKVAYLINSNQPSSLGLHPILYFYSQEGRFKVASFHAFVEFMMDLEQRKKINEFINAREKFEELIYKYDYVVQQINRKHRSSQLSVKPISKFFLEVMDLINSGKNPEECLSELVKREEYNYLTLLPVSEIPILRKDFTTSNKSAAYIKEVFETAPKCKICNGLIHRNSISVDHIVRKRDGGTAELDNAQITHPYCNTGYKN